MADQHGRQSRPGDPMNPNACTAKAAFVGVIHDQRRNNQSQKHPFHGEAGNPVGPQSPAITNVLTNKIAKDGAEERIQNAMKHTTGVEPRGGNDSGLRQGLSVPDQHA